MKYLFDIDGKHHEIELSEGETKRLEYAEGRFADVTVVVVVREPTPTRTGYGFIRVDFDNGNVWLSKEATIASVEKNDSIMKTINFRGGVADFDKIAKAGIVMTCNSDMDLIISDEDYLRLEREFPAAFEDSYIVEQEN